MNIGYVNKDFTPLYAESTGTKTNLQLLWGDRLRIVEDSGGSDRIKVKVRGKTGFVKPPYCKVVNIRVEEAGDKDF